MYHQLSKQQGQIEAEHRHRPEEVLIQKCCIERCIFIHEVNLDVGVHRKREVQPKLIGLVAHRLLGLILPLLCALWVPRIG